MKKTLIKNANLVSRGEVNKYNLSFISDEDLFRHVLETVEKYRFNIDLKEFNKNLIDPIKLTFDSVIYNQDIKKTIANEVIRQLDKSNSNLIGYFNQNIFKYISKEWNVPKEGYDIINKKENIYVEMKNKHNTMNSSSGAKTYMKMQNTIIDNPDSKCLLVEVIAKNSQDIPWVVTIDKVRMSSRENIRRISIDKFYEMVTGEKYAFRNLCRILPEVIKDTIKDIETKHKKNTVFKELNELSDDLLTSIYLLSFKKYEGFDDFKF